MCTERWIKFFSRAGIPLRAATMYASTFADNRIQMDMLLDLNKEYLRDMGITLMGDVIAILRHARQVHEELTHEKLLSGSKNPSSPIVKPEGTIRESVNDSISPKPVKNPPKIVRAASKSSSSSSFNSSSTSSQSSPAPSPPKKVSVPSCISDPRTRQVSGTRPSGITPLPHSFTTTSDKSTVKKVVMPLESLKRRSGEISRSKPSDLKQEIEEIPVPVKKVRRVLPEHEGGYKIKMPSGSTPRSQQILAKQKELSKKTVFDRLGRSSSPNTEPLTAAVSSTTSDPTFTVTGLEVAKKTKSSSVFSRLGDKQVSSTSVVPAVEEKLVHPSILKTPNPKTPLRPVVVQKTASMVADSLGNTSGRDVQSRIGMSKQVTGIKRSAAAASCPTEQFVIKRTATIVPKSATVVSLSKPVKAASTDGILGCHSGDFNRTVKSRLGHEEPKRTLLVKPVSRVTATSVSVKQRLQSPRVNGSIPSKRVTFGSSSVRASCQPDVFSRLGR